MAKPNIDRIMPIRRFAPSTFGPNSVSSPPSANIVGKRPKGSITQG